jgi:hypothetical protein
MMAVFRRYVGLFFCFANDESGFSELIVLLCFIARHRGLELKKLFWKCSLRKASFRRSRLCNSVFLQAAEIVRRIDLFDPARAPLFRAFKFPAGNRTMFRLPSLFFSSAVAYNTNQFFSLIFRFSVDPAIQRASHEVAMFSGFAKECNFSPA